MSLSPAASTAEMSACSESPVISNAEESRPVRVPTAVKSTSSLDHDSIDGMMTVHRKKKRQRFLLPKSARYVVANSMKHALEVYTNDSRSELVYLLSLAGAVLSFESDNANIVMEKCFCVEVKTWKKKNTVHFESQGFIFFEEDQARMLLWVKCIHLAIKRATTLDSELFRSPSTASSVEPLRRFSDSEELRAQMGAAVAVGSRPGEDRNCASNVTACSPGSSPTSSSGFAAARDKFTQRLVIDPAARIVTAGRTMLTPTRSSSVNASGERQSSTLNRWSAIFSHDKQQLTRSPMSSTATDTPSSPIEVTAASPKPSPWKRSTKATTDVSSEAASSHSIDPVSSPRSRSFRGSSHAATPSQSDAVPVSPTVKSSTPQLEKHSEVNAPRPMPGKPETIGSVAAEPQQQDSPAEVLDDDDPEPVTLRLLTFMLAVAALAGASDASVFLPLALAGALSHFCNQPQRFSSWTLSSVAVYLASSCHVLFGIGSASAFLYNWGYANYKTNRRRRAQRKAVVHFRDTRASQATAEVDHFEIPNWMRYPDVDRVEWLNKVFLAGWPYLKVAIKESVAGSLNPVLDAQKPAFMNSLSLVRMDLGTKTPHISGVKFVSANTLTDEVTLDVDVRVVTDKSFVAELKMVSHLGAAVSLSLRELFLVGTLRITLNPLAKYWPCFGGLNLSFTTRPVFDFSLTAAKINIANVPFVSEWLHTFLYDLLVDTFVWPRVLNIPLWDEQGNPAES